MARIVMEQSFETPMTDEEFSRRAQKLDPCLEARNSAWRRSYISRDKKRMTCEFEAPDAEAIRDALRLSGVSYDRVWAAEVFEVEQYPELMEKLRAVQKP